MILVTPSPLLLSPTSPPLQPVHGHTMFLIFVAEGVGCGLGLPRVKAFVVVKGHAKTFFTLALV